MPARYSRCPQDQGGSPASRATSRAERRSLNALTLSPEPRPADDRRRKERPRGTPRCQGVDLLPMADKDRLRLGQNASDISPSQSPVASSPNQPVGMAASKRL